MTLRLLTSALCLLAAPPAQAQTAPPRLVAALSGDWNNDENPDAVLIYAHEDGMSDLVVMQGNGYSGLQPVITLPGAIWSGVMAGQFPGLEPRSATSFAIHSEQTGIGREPWQQVITVAFRQGELRVAGFDYLFYDRLDPSHNGTCSVNLLSGQYTLTRGQGDEAPVEQREGAANLAAFPLAELTEDFFPEACSALFE